MGISPYFFQSRIVDLFEQVFVEEIEESRIRELENFNDIDKCPVELLGQKARQFGALAWTDIYGEQYQRDVLKNTAYLNANIAKEPCLQRIAELNNISYRYELLSEEQKKEYRRNKAMGEAKYTPYNDNVIRDFTGIIFYIIQRTSRQLGILDISYLTRTYKLHLPTFLEVVDVIVEDNYVADINLNGFMVQMDRYP